MKCMRLIWSQIICPMVSHDFYQLIYVDDILDSDQQVKENKK